MKTLESILNSSERRLSREELINFRGGYQKPGLPSDPGEGSRCWCHNNDGGDGEWVDCPSGDLATCCSGYSNMNCM